MSMNCTRGHRGQRTHAGPSGRQTISQRDHNKENVCGGPVRRVAGKQCGERPPVLLRENRGGPVKVWESGSDSAGEVAGDRDVLFVRRSQRLAQARRMRTNQVVSVAPKRPVRLQVEVTSQGNGKREKVVRKVTMAQGGDRSSPPKRKRLQKAPQNTPISNGREVCQPPEDYMLDLVEHVTRELSFHNDVTMDKSFEELKRLSDPFLMAPYASDIMKYYKDHEIDSHQSDKDTASTVAPRHRQILIDWLVDVQNHLLLEAEALHLAVALTDAFLARRHVGLDHLQLLGVTCLFVACKFEEIYVPEIETLCDLCMKMYDKPQVLSMEQNILHVLQFCLFYPTSMDFLNIYLTMAEVNDRKFIYTCYYLLDLALPDPDMHLASPSLQAAAAFYLSGLICKDERRPKGTHAGNCRAAVSLLEVDFTRITGYPKTELRQMSRKMLKRAQSIRCDDHKAPYNKYNCETYHFVSSQTALVDNSALLCKLSTAR